jgi:hypothetical protein
MEGAIDESHLVTFPKESSGARILGRIQMSQEVKKALEKRRRIAAEVFDEFYFTDNHRRGRKQLTKMIKGPHLMRYYLDKHEDQLMVDFDARAKREKMVERNALGFKRRRPRPKGAKAKAQAGNRK